MFLQQFGAELSRKTMVCWVEQDAELLKPIYRSQSLLGHARLSRRKLQPFVPQLVEQLLNFSSVAMAQGKEKLRPQ